MSYDFNADEIFEIAGQIERNGAKFYKLAAKIIDNPSARELFLSLSEMENEHEKTFISLRASLSNKEKEKTVFDPEEESVLYLKALADSRVFLKKDIPDILSHKNQSEKDFIKIILDYAIGAEKDSIVFYLGMKDLVPENMGKNKIDQIIKEEMSHIRLLGKEMAALNKQAK
ncbi:MAG: ferritin family protein [Deltaproteobacteria bacterium]|jgi:rubrerythrin|nr:ferritin family protein [Deltaproteobacteria bacterium]